MTDQTIFERCCGAATEARSPHDGLPMLGLDPDFGDRPDATDGCDDGELSDPEVRALVRAVIQTIIDNTPSLRTAEELTRILGEA